MIKPKIYTVGGAVRDRILGNAPKDHDYVVVGADVQWMLDQGFKQVGLAFPVFLHPETGDEYALARREKKVAPGYQGFEFEFGPHVTLEDDLSRRDLTMNAIAFDEATGTIIDPFDGSADLRAKVIRHTSEAFSEDPLRVLRVARFHGRYMFNVADETVELCKFLVKSGELDHLSADRVWGEVTKMLSDAHPSWAIKFLNEVGAVELDCFNGLFNVPTASLLDELVDEAELTFVEKAYMLLRLEELSKTELEAFRVPIPLARKIAFFGAIQHQLINPFLTDLLDLNAVVTVFDKFRIEIKDGKLSEVRTFISKFKNLDESELPFLETLAKVFDALLKLDFTELTLGVPKGEIKALVRDKKVETVKDTLFCNKYWIS